MENNSYILDFLFENQERCFFEKASVVEKICQEACAFANQNGGCIVVGVGEQHRIIGVTDEDVKRINSALLNTVTPPLPFTYSLIPRDDKQVLVISIWEGANKPYACSGRYYTSISDTLLMMDSAQMQAMFDLKVSQNSNWERILVNDASMDDLNLDVVNLFKKNLASQNKVMTSVSEKEVLKKLGFIRNGLLTNAAIVVTGKQPSFFFSQTRIRLSVFGEGNVLENVKLIDCSIVEAVDKLLNFILDYYPSTIQIEGIYRREVNSIPKVALREGILNAIVHRKYDDYQSFVKVNIYPDRLEIINSGDLMGGLTVDDLKKRHSSLLRNPDIANAFFVLRYIEMAGSGTLRIIEECKNNNLKIPIWQQKEECVILTFWINRPTNKHKYDVRQIVAGLTNDEMIRNSLNKILVYIHDNPNAKSKVISGIIGKSYATVKRYIIILKDAGLIEYRGSLKTGGWFLVS